ncbi:MAG: hypothetical protein U9N02_06420 [Campylobacterota bacterium]|nr:hypothetical protein [Campylobacterota bacterium]
MYSHYDLPRFSISLLDYTSENELVLDIDGNIIKDNSDEIFKLNSKIQEIIQNYKNELLKVWNEKKNIENKAKDFLNEINMEYYLTIHSSTDRNKNRERYIKYSITIGKYNAENNESKHFELDENGEIENDEITDMVNSDKQKIVEYFYE